MQLRALEFLNACIHVFFFLTRQQILRSTTRHLCVVYIVSFRQNPFYTMIVSTPYILFFKIYNSTVAPQTISLQAVFLFFASLKCSILEALLTAHSSRCPQAHVVLCVIDLYERYIFFGIKLSLRWSPCRQSSRFAVASCPRRFGRVENSTRPSTF